jgi:hypothetical protein
MSVILNLGDKITAGNRADATFFYKKRVADDSGTLLTEAETDENNRELLAQKLFDKASIVYTAGGVKASTNYSVKGTDFGVTRAGVKNVVNRAGVLTEIPANTPATEFSNGVLKGTLIEPARTNLLQRSEEFDNAVWVKESLSVTPNNAVAPDGTTTADLITRSGTGASINQVLIGTAPNVMRTATIYTKVATGLGTDGIILRISDNSSLSNFVQMNIDFVTNIGETSTGGNGTSVTGSIEDAGNGWYRVKVSGIANTSGSNSRVSVFTRTATTNNGANIWGAQLETGSVATSYIRTTNTTITQPADVITATGVSGLIGQTSGGFVAKVNARNFGTGRTIAVIGTIENGIHIFQTGLTVTALFRSSDTDRATLTGTFVAGANAVAVRYDGTAVALHVNGAEAQTGTATSWSPGVMSSYYFGCDSADLNQYNDIITDADLYTTTLTQAQANTRTTL